MRRLITILCIIMLLALGCSANKGKNDRYNSDTSGTASTILDSEDLPSILTKSLNFEAVRNVYHITNSYSSGEIDGVQYLSLSFSPSVNQWMDERLVLLEKKAQNKWTLLYDGNGLLPDDKNYDKYMRVIDSIRLYDLDWSLVVDYNKKQCYFADKKLLSYNDLTNLRGEVENLKQELTDFDKVYYYSSVLIKRKLDNFTYEIVLPTDKNSYNLGKLKIDKEFINIDRPGYWIMWVKYLYDEYNVKLENGFNITVPVYDGYTDEDIASLKQTLEQDYNQKKTEYDQKVNENFLGDSGRLVSGNMTGSGIDRAISISFEADKRLLSTSELQLFSNWELDVMRNGIYARHGRKFVRKDMQNFFNSQNWYSINPDYNDGMLNQFEKRNAIMILNYQKVSK